MNVPPHIEEFQKVAALILGQLYSAFPIATDVDRSAIARTVVGSDDFASINLPSGRKVNELISHTTIWLRNEGFTHNGGTTPWDSVTLSGKGLAVLNAVPPGFEGSLGQKLSDVARDEKRDWSGIGDLIGGMIGGLTKSISNP